MEAHYISGRSDNPNPRLLILAILLVIFLHLILGVILFSYQQLMNTQSKEIPQPIAQQEEYNHHDVVLYDEPKQVEQAMPEQSPQQLPEPIQTVANTATSPITNPPSSVNIKPMVAPSHEKDATEKMDMIDEEKKDNKKLESEAKESEIAIQETQAPAPLVINKKPASAQQPQKKALAQANRAPSNTRKKLQLADLTALYNDKMHGHPPTGSSTSSSTSRGNGQFLQGSISHLPEDKKISFMRYRDKLNQIISNMYSIHNRQLGALPIGAQIMLYVAMAPDGSFKDVHIIQSSGYQSMDSVMKTVYIEAGKRFPPIPKGLDSSLFKGTIPLVYSHVSANQKTTWLPF